MRSRAHSGFTLIELALALAIGSMLLVLLSTVLSQALAAEARVRERNALAQEAHFALERMTAAVAETQRLILPLAENDATVWSEAVREQWVPAVNANDSAVLAVAMSRSLDRDGDGIADADNDGDGRVDEDPGSDLSNDGGAGILGIDDDGDGTIDESVASNDDEHDDKSGEDPFNGYDDDNDGSIDEDPPADLNDDGAPGLAGVDDDEDLAVDEGALADDDEDGLSDEDWIDAVVFHLQGDALVERMPVPWDTDGDADVDGLDWTSSTLANGVRHLRVERLPRGARRSELIELSLTLTGASGTEVSVQTRVRAGAGS